MSGGAICAICYEDARPLCEDLQSISACGHVFHELCLQQWIEYCPAGRKPTCPLCKQSCTTRDVHRLYFQSTVNDSTQSPSKNLQTPAGDPKQDVNAPALRRLECQLAAAKTTLQTRNEQLKELDCQVVANLRRAESAEASNVVVRGQLVQCKQSLTRIQEELKCCSNERAMLQEKNQSLAKDLAAHKLVADTDLGEEEIFRLVSNGSGTNSEAIIETLTKSLILRNKSYKELMARCNELGMGESRALRKSEKTNEHLKKMKARVHELEKILEDKDHACLRDLNRSSSKLQSDEIRSGHRPSNNQTGSKRINAPRISSSDRPASHSTLSIVQDIGVQKDIVQDNSSKLSGSRQILEVVPRAELPEVQLPNIVRERGLTGIEHVQPTCPQNFNTSSENFSSRKRSRSEDETASPDSRKDNGATSTGFSCWVIKSRHLLQEIKMMNESKTLTDSGIVTGRQRALTPSSVAPKSFFRPELLAPSKDDGSAAASSSICTNQVDFIPPRIERNADTEVFVTAPEKSFLVNKPSMSTANNYAGFAKRAPSDRPSTSSSTFIVSGADGRGGRVTVFKPPSLSSRGFTITATQKSKKPKISGTGLKGRQGSLQIEHFFGREKS